MEKEIIFEAKHMHKEFGPTIALKDVDFTLRRGEIRGLIGENGSGKSTIMSIASGMQSATSGEMFYHGKPWHPQTMVESQKQGISMILQEANSIPNITVAHNIFAGREKEFMSHGIFNSGKMAKEAQKILDSFGISHIRAQDSINKYSFEDRKLVELVRCVDENTEILVVDETTTALSQQGRDILYDLIHRMASEGKAVVFISHDIDEIFDQCNALTVLRDGEIVGTVSEEEILACRNSDNRKEAVKPVRHMMVGREMGDKYYREDMERSSLPETILEASHLTFGQIKDFSLSLNRGEIVGIGGLSGCGMHEVGRAIFGLEKLKSGSVTCNNKPIRTWQFPQVDVSSMALPTAYFQSNSNLQLICSFASITYIEPALQTANLHGKVKVWTCGYESEDYLMDNFGTEGDQTYQGFRTAPIEDVAFPLVQILDKLNGYSYADKEETVSGLVESMEADDASAKYQLSSYMIPYSSSIIVTDDEQFANFKDSYVYGNADGTCSIVTSAQLQSLMVTYNEEATYEELVAFFDETGALTADALGE